MKIKSTYSDKNFELIVLYETETHFICKHLPQDYKKFVDGDKEFALRKCLVGKGNIYDFVNEENEQISLFDLGVEL